MSSSAGRLVVLAVAVAAAIAATAGGMYYYKNMSRTEGAVTSGSAIKDQQLPCLVEKVADDQSTAAAALYKDECPDTVVKAVVTETASATYNARKIVMISCGVIAVMSLVTMVSVIVYVGVQLPPWGSHFSPHGFAPGFPLYSDSECWMMMFLIRAGSLMNLLSASGAILVASLAVLGFAQFLFYRPEPSTKDQDMESADVGIKEEHRPLPPFRTRLSGFLRRHRLGLAGGSAVLLGIVTAIVTTSILFPDFYIYTLPSWGENIRLAFTYMSYPLGGPRLIMTILFAIKALEVLAFIAYMFFRYCRPSKDASKPIHARLTGYLSELCMEPEYSARMIIKTVLVLLSIVATDVSILHTQLWYVVGLVGIPLTLVLFFSNRISMLVGHRLAGSKEVKGKEQEKEVPMAAP